MPRREWRRKKTIEWKIRDLTNFCIQEFSVKCHDNGDKVWCQETSNIVAQKLIEALGFLPAWAINHKQGEVLNRFRR